MEERLYSFNLNEGEHVSISVAEDQIITMIREGQLIDIDKVFCRTAMRYLRIRDSDFRECLPVEQWSFDYRDCQDINRKILTEMTPSLRRRLHDYATELYQYVAGRHRLDPTYLTDRFKMIVRLTGDRRVADLAGTVDVLDLVLHSMNFAEEWIYRRQFYLPRAGDGYTDVQYAPHLKPKSK